MTKVQKHESGAIPSPQEESVIYMHKE